MARENCLQGMRLWYEYPCVRNVHVRAGLPAHLQAELALMSPSMVSDSLHSELGVLLALGVTGQMGIPGQPSNPSEAYSFGEPARIPTLAAMCQIRPTQPDACASILDALCMVQLSHLAPIVHALRPHEPGKNQDNGRYASSAW